MTSFSWGPLRVNFGQKAWVPPLALSPYSAPSPATALAAIDHSKQMRDSLELDELRTREAQIEELLITDPLRAEEMIRQGDLEELDGGPDDGS